MSEQNGRPYIRWGIIGCGNVTEVKSGPGFRKAQGSRLVAVMRRNGALAADYARRHGVARWYDDAQRLIDDREVDAIYVATPPGSHLDYARLVAAAGKPCYMEKPMARSAAECDAMIAAFAAAKQKLFVAYYRRGQPRFHKVRELLATGILGRVTSISYRMTKVAGPASGAPLPWRLRASDAGGGLLLDVGSHVLDIIDFLFGPLGHVHGDAARMTTAADVEDVVVMTFRTPAGIRGSAAWNFAGSFDEDRLEISGTAGRLSLSVFGIEPIQLERDGRTQAFEVPAPEHVAQPLIQTIVNELLGRGTCPSTGESARRTSAVMDQVLSAYYGGRNDAFWDRPQTWPGLQPATRG